MLAGVALNATLHCLSALAERKAALCIWGDKEGVRLVYREGKGKYNI
jgi:hypothetical protein